MLLIGCRWFSLILLLIVVLPKTKATLNKVFGDRVRELRTEKGWSQDELAHRADLHRTYVGGVERAERNVTLQTVEKLAKALGVEPWELMK